MAAVITDTVAIGAADNTSSLTTGSLTSGGSNRVLYVAVGSGAGTPTDPTGVKWGGSGGTSLTQLGSTLNLGANCKWSLWRLIAPTAQSSTVYASWAGNQDERWIIAAAVEDADQTTPNNTVATATGTAATNPTVAATSVSGDLVLDFVAFLNGGGQSLTLTADASQAELEDLGGGTGIGPYEGAAASSETAAGSSTTMSWTISTTNARDWGIFAFAVNQASASTLVPRSMLLGVG